MLIFPLMFTLPSIPAGCLTIMILIGGSLFCPAQSVQFGSSDTAMTKAFAWAKAQALHFRGNAADPVGPWYESALPPRDAFCMRDVSHQCIGAAILGLDAENKNMFTLFARNISAKKDWCSYWEIDKTSAPSPADYRNDAEFWYNLDANFDLLSASWRLASWTGDSTYLDKPPFLNFQEQTVGPYIDSWVLQPDSLLTRPAHPNAPVPYQDTDAFHRCRGLPSYSEGIDNMKAGVDLVAALYRGLATYAEILNRQNRSQEAYAWQQQAERYRSALETKWWSDSLHRYYTWYSNDGRFGLAEGEVFLLWFDALRDTARTRSTLTHLASQKWNIETTSYFPNIFYREGWWDTARTTILYLSDQHTPRREYPEVSYGVIQGIVLGLMGIEVIPGTHTLSTLHRSTHNDEAWIKELPVLGTTLAIKHTSKTSTTLSNTGGHAITWRAKFSGAYKKATINHQVMPLRQEQTAWGKPISYIDLPVPAGAKLIVAVQ